MEETVAAVVGEVIEEASISAKRLAADILLVVVVVVVVVVLAR
jgi:hypothetical protein